jgi:predicted enzyme related to lactoylglutathione lyase
VKPSIERYVTYNHTSSFRFCRGTGLLSGLAILLLLTALSGCGTIRVTPVTTPPTDVFHTGKIVWHDLLTPDVQAAKDFYAGVFGWTFEEHGRYTVVSNDGKAIAGMIQVRPESEAADPARWLVSLSVVDVDAAAQQLREAGGTVHQGPKALDNRGRFALVKDPQGAELVLLRSTSGDPPDVDETAMGSWLWNELWSRDPAASLAFYQSLVGYEYEAASKLTDYWIMARDEHWRAGLRSIVLKDWRGQWVPAIRVADPYATAEQVVANGGEVVIHPGEAPSDGNVALIADPTGALLIIQRWPRLELGEET